jgi:hypothetical protein
MLATVALSVVGAGAWYGFLRPDPPIPPDDPPPLASPPPDPRLVFDTPFRNVRPEVRYLGDAACAGYHADIDRTYHAHPMGRSAAMTSRAEPIERYDSGANNPFTVRGLRVELEPAGDRVVHRVTAEGRSLPAYAVSADVVIGSGTRGRSYLTVTDGAVWQTTASWFTPVHRWDLSPGFEPATRRRILPECLFCRTDRVEPVPGAINSYKEPLFPGQVAIGCERCHGPGGLHVDE